MCLKTLNLSCIIKGQPIVIILSNPHIFLLEWVPYCRLFSQKYLGIILTNNIVLITSKFFMMNQKTGPCDPSKACLSHNPSQLSLCNSLQSSTYKSSFEWSQAHLTFFFEDMLLSTFLFLNLSRDDPSTYLQIPTFLTVGNFTSIFIT